MITENKEIETGFTNEKLNVFFKDEIDPKTMAKYIRRVNHILALTTIREDDNNPLNREWLDDGYYHLNKLAEVLDPNMCID